MLTCKETSWLLSRSMDESLSWPQRWNVRLHLWLCAQCRRFKRQLDWLDFLAGKDGMHLSEWAEDGIDPLPEAARERLRLAIESHSHDGGHHHGL